MCISIHALVSGLLLRIERDGYLATPSDFRAILALRYPRATLRERIAERVSLTSGDAPDRFAQALLVLDGIRAT